MATIRPFDMFDLLKYNNVNLDLLTETFYTNFYGQYLSKWPEYCVVAENTVSMIQGYLMGKVEGSKGDDQKKNWHGHVTAVTVAPQFRRQGLARSLMDYLEDVTTSRHDGYFVDLFVRPSNKVAINMYTGLGYIVYRTVLGYYSGSGDKDSEDAYDMRKAMPKDKEKKTVIPLKEPIQPHEDQVVYKLKQSIETGKIQEYKNECNEGINTCDEFIKKLCKNNYMEFLSSLSSVGSFRSGIKDIRKYMNEMNECLVNVEKNYFEKAQTSLNLKQTYSQITDAENQLLQTKRIIERCKKIEELIQKDILTVAFHELEFLRNDSQDETLPISLKQWLWSRITNFEEKLSKTLQRLKHKILVDLENQEMQAGELIIDEIKKQLLFLGKQFMLESDSEQDQLTYTEIDEPIENALNKQSSLQASRLGGRKISYNKANRGQGTNYLKKSGVGGMIHRTSRFKQSIQFNQNLSRGININLSTVFAQGSPTRQNKDAGFESPKEFGKVLSPRAGGKQEQTYTLETVQKQVNIAQECVVDIDFRGIDNVRKLFKNIDQEKKFINYLETQRNDRIIKLAKLNRRMKIDESIQRMVGFFVIQIHLSYNLPQIYDSDKLKLQWEQSLLQFQKSLEQVIVEYDYNTITLIKKDVITFVLSLRDLGIIQDLSFLNNLIKLHDVYLDKLLDHLERKVADILSAEDYNQISVNNAEDLFQTVDKYEIDLGRYFKMQQNVQLQYPVYLPYSYSVIYINDLIHQFIEFNFEYWQFLLQDKSDFALAYGSSDRILIRLAECLSEHFFHKNKFTILQRAQFSQNLEYIVKSFKYFKKAMFLLANSGAHILNRDIYAFTFQAENMMNDLKKKCEDSIYAEFRFKINDLLSTVEGIDWAPKKPESQNFNFVEDLVSFLRSTLMQLDITNRDLAKQCYIVSFQHISNRILELLATSKNIQKINQFGMIKLQIEFQTLTNEAKGVIQENQQVYDQQVYELQQTISLFLESGEQGIKEILDEDMRRVKYKSVNLKKVLGIVEKYKLEKIKPSQGTGLIDQMINRLPPVKKADITLVIKRLRELLNIK